MKYKNTLIVNLFGGPGTGKSTTMAHIFAELKWKGYDCEMSTEYAKDKVWEGSSHILVNQFYVSGKQYHKLRRLNGKLEVVITDSPILLGIYYGKDEPQEFKDLLVKYHESFNNLNIFLRREKPYNMNGRLQTEEKAKAIDAELYNIVGINRGDFLEIPAKRESIETILEIIENKLKNQYSNIPTI